MSTSNQVDIFGATGSDELTPKQEAYYVNHPRAALVGIACLNALFMERLLNVIPDVGTENDADTLLSVLETMDIHCQAMTAVEQVVQFATFLGIPL